MPYIPHTAADIQEMLAAIGVAGIDDLFDEIPAELKIKTLKNIPIGISEMEATRLMRDRSQQDQAGLCFIGAGAYEHHIPAAVWDITSRGEYLTAYTPYQAEASQGTLQLLYEFQTMMANLTGMDVANASLYDGASALAEAVLMAVRCHQKTTSKKILMPRTVHPHYRKVVNTVVKNQGIECLEVEYDLKTGKITEASLQKYNNTEITALVIPQPNFFGHLEEVDALTHWAHQQGAMVIAVINPLALALLKEPGKWGQQGADIACGEAQPLGIPLASGGPYLGFMTCQSQWLRQIPGRIVGKTEDKEGNTAFTLTLQAREQHIRRSKATSNICTNQSLMVTAATIYMSLLGAEGMRRVAVQSHERAISLLQKLKQIPGVQEIFQGPIFNEFVIRLPQASDDVLEKLASLGIQAGFNLKNDYPELGDSILVCATETKTENDLELYKKKLMEVVACTSSS
jgi:glycine dehydrogenase subunit 1